MRLGSIFIAIVMPIMVALPIAAQDKAPAVSEKITVKLLSGETLVGKVAGIKHDALNLVTDYGVVSIPVAKIAEESRKSLNIAEEKDTTKLNNRISELEALVASLREENATLRKGGHAAPSNAAPSQKASAVPNQTDEAGVTYKLSKSGKRHNSRCRYFGSAGDACGPNDGEPCKVCGG
jgi:hypothetical protein